MMRAKRPPTKKNNIYFFLSNLSGGGAQRTMVNLLRSIDRSTFLPTLVLLDYNCNDVFASLIPHDITIVNLKSKARYAAWKVKKIIEYRQPDVLFSTLPQVNFAVWLGNKTSRIKSKLILRESSYRKIGINTTAFQQWLYRMIYRDVDMVVGLSDGVVKHMVESYRLYPSKVTRIYNPVDIKRIQEKAHEKCKITYRKRFKLVSCGRLTKVKNYPNLIKALSILKQKGHTDFELFIMGEGPDKKLIEKLINDYCLDDHIKLIGFQINPYSYMKQADLFVLSSLWEGFGHVIVEAMACETPVLATDCPYGPREILKDGKFGWLVPNNDPQSMAAKLEHLLQNQQEIKNMASVSINRVKDFNEKVIIKEYEKLFKSVVQK